jgi:hypothetical protein
VEGEAGKVDKGSATMLATSRKEGDVQRDMAMKPEVETIAMFEGSEDAVVTTDKGLGTRRVMMKTRAEARLRTKMMMMRVRLRMRKEHNREFLELTQGELVILCGDMTGLYMSIGDLRR